MNEGLLSSVAESLDKGRIRQDNEAIILSAAERVFARYGFRGTTMQQIADAADLPKANLHYYFGNKQTLYLRVLEEILQDWLAPLESLCASADPKTSLADYVGQKIAFSLERPEASRLFANEILQGAPVVSPLLKRSCTTWWHKRRAFSTAGSLAESCVRWIPRTSSLPSGR